MNGLSNLFMSENRDISIRFGLGSEVYPYLGILPSKQLTRNPYRPGEMSRVRFAHRTENPLALISDRPFSKLIAASLA